MRSMPCAQSRHNFDDPHRPSFWWWILIALWHSVTKKGSTFRIWDTCRGFCFQGESFFFFLLELMEIRLYLGASLCIYLFGSWCILVRLFILRGVTFIVPYVSCFTTYWFIFMMLFIDICLYFVFCEIKNLFLFTCIFHTCVYASCLVFQEKYKLIWLSYCLHLHLMDSN